MKNMKKKLAEKMEGLKPSISKGTEFLMDIFPKVFSTAFVLLVSTSMVFAASSDGSAEWNDIIELICTWIVRAGAAYLIYGGIQVAKGYKTHNPDAKDDGVDTVVTACMIIAVPEIVKGIAKA